MKRLFLYSIFVISLLSCVKDPVENTNSSLLGTSNYTGNDIDLRVRDFLDDYNKEVYEGLHITSMAGN